MSDPMQPLRVCTRCVMDTTDPWIVFDAEGVCNHCHYYETQIRPLLLPADEAARQLNRWIERIRAGGRGKPYDCVLGISGGLDSSYLALLAKRHGLRPLLVHMDNGWDSELAVKNIENIVRKTGFGYYNYVVDWEEFKDVQLAYLRASVVDIEVVTDHAITALLYHTAERLDIKFILSGGNYVSESIMPARGWNYHKNDLANLLDIHRRYGERKLNTYPVLGMYRAMFYQQVRNIQPVELLNLVDYRQREVMRDLEQELGWRYYGGKHYESVFTKFYQAQILPVKFNVDKRKVHGSNLICSGQLTREEALARLRQPLYAESELKQDTEYVIKKLGLTPAEFAQFMAATPVPHEAFATDRLRGYHHILLRFWHGYYGFIHGLKRLLGVWSAPASQRLRSRRRRRGLTALSRGR